MKRLAKIVNSLIPTDEADKVVLSVVGAGFGDGSGVVGAGVVGAGVV